jgi:hypothetical protein
MYRIWFWVMIERESGLRCRRVAASATRDRGRSSRIESTTSPSPTAAGQHRCPLTFGLWTKEASLSRGVCSR